MVLYVVTVSYVAFCCLILGWLVATEDTVIEALVVLGGAYGTLLTGVPVLIAVLVARQQLEANRRQHVATVKRSFKEQLDVISAANQWVNSILAMSYDDQLENQDPDVAGFQLWRLNSTQIERGKSNLAPNIIFSFESLSQMIDDFQRRYMWAKECELRELYDMIQKHACSLRDRLDKEQNELSQYWS